MFLLWCSNYIVCYGSLTERKQLALYPESVVNNQAAKAYAKFKSKAEIIQSGKDIETIINIGKKLKNLYQHTFQKESSDPTENFQWEYILVKNDKVKNAWCMPGGKIAVFTGILDVAQNENGLATIMGHEIAHAVAKHSVERMSQANGN